MVQGHAPGIGRDHLRVCGADVRQRAFDHLGQGSPPRVRSRRHDRGPVSGRSGITSACAEQTPPFPVLMVAREDHLRVCGADLVVSLVGDEVVGSPPRVRSRLVPQQRIRVPAGITSACAEQTTLHLPA